MWPDPEKLVVMLLVDIFFFLSLFTFLAMVIGVFQAVPGAAAVAVGREADPHQGCHGVPRRHPSKLGRCHSFRALGEEPDNSLIWGLSDYSSIAQQTAARQHSRYGLIKCGNG